jgi:hypothetical protein
MMLTVSPVYSQAVTFAVSSSHALQPIAFFGQVTAPNLGVVVYVTQNKGYGSIPSNSSNCEPDVQSEYPDNASAGQRIVIITTVVSGCVGAGVAVSQVIVNILPPESSEILSTAPASPAINTVTAPATGGRWSLIVQVIWNGNPASGNFEIFETTITIKINGSSAISTVTSSPTVPPSSPIHGNA